MFANRKKELIRKYRLIRENINIRLYDSKPVAKRIIDVLSVLAAVVGAVALVIYQGFETSPEAQRWFYFIFRGILYFYYLKFFVGYIYSFSPKTYFMQNRLTGIFLFLLLIALVGDKYAPDLFIDSIGEPSAGSNRNFSSVLEQVSFFLLLIVEIAKASEFLPSLRLSPPKLFVLSFLILIFLGTGLLMLPKMTTGTEPMPFFDALFTATSASCVTGLTVVDIASYFTDKGQIIIMILVQLGGLNIITFASFFLLLSRKNLGIKNQTLIKDSFEASSFHSSISLLKGIFVTTATIELVGALLFFISWKPDFVFEDLWEKIFFSVFHSISAFNNAGMSIIPDGGLTNPIMADAYFFQLIIASLIILGGIGFMVYDDVLNIRHHYKGKTLKRLSLNSRIILTTTLGLILFGMFFFMFFEWNGSLEKMNVPEKVMASFFQSVASRTAGFNTVDLSTVLSPTLILIILLMFIGASPVSTGGGIKTTTFAVLCLTAIRTVRGKQRITVEKNEIEKKVIYKAFTILLFSALYVIVCILILTLTDPDKNVLALAFEEVSAFSTTGFSTGITPDISVAGRLVLVISMFMGRIGLLTFGFALSLMSRPEAEFNYPTARIYIG